MGGSRALALGWPLVAGQLTAGVLGPLTVSFAAGSTTPIPVTGLGPGETVASVTGSFTVSGNSIVPSAGLVAGSYNPVVTTSTGRTLTITVTANATLATLPAVTGGYLAAYGLSRLISGYASPAVRVQRSSDSTQQDIGFDSTGLIDMAAASSFANGSELRIVTFYDQTGGGKHATGSATAPSVLPILTTQRAVYGNAFPARPIILHQGLPYAYTSQQVAGLTIPTSLSVDRANVGFLDAVCPNVSLQNDTISQLGTVAGSSRLNLFTQATTPGLCSFQYTAASGANPNQTFTTAVGLSPRVNLQVLGLVSRSTGQTIISEEMRQTFAAQESLTLTGGFLGSGNGGNAAYYSRGDRFAFVVFSGSATDAEITSAQQTLSGIIGSAKRSNRVAIAGSSTPEGQGANNLVAGSYATQSYVRLAMGLLDREADLYNTAVSGRTAAALSSGSNLTTELDPLFASGKNNIFVLDIGSNDVAAGTAPATIYANLKSHIQGRKTAGFKTVICTIGPRSDVTGTNETNRTTLNTSIRTGQTDMGYDALIDVAAIAALDNPGAANTNYVQESGGGAYIHKNNAGHLLLAQKAAPILQGLLA